MKKEEEINDYGEHIQIRSKEEYQVHTWIYSEDGYQLNNMLMQDRSETANENSTAKIKEISERRIKGVLKLTSIKQLIRKHRITIAILIVIGIVVCLIIAGANTRGHELELSKQSKEKKISDKEDIYEKGYHLPIPDDEHKEAEEDCNYIMENIRDIHQSVDKDTSVSKSISDEIAREMLKILEKKGIIALSKSFSLDMCNYKEMETFLISCEEGVTGEIIVYEIHIDGGIGRKKYTYDGENMYVLDTNASWNNQDIVVLSSSYNRLKEWEFTEKGWFSYEYCVPVPPEVTEIVDGNEMLRIRPIKSEYKEIAEKYLLPLSYQGNNLFSTNWDSEHMENIDYCGLYEYLYTIKYQKKFDAKQFANGIPKEEFENIMTEYLPVTAELIRKCTTFDEETQLYKWIRLGCGNYSPNSFSTSIPEITGIKENADGTRTLTVDAVCERVGEDAVMSHELTVKLQEGGGIRYLKNTIIKSGSEYFPEYQYRGLGNELVSERTEGTLG